MALRAVCVLTGHIMGFIFFNQADPYAPTYITGEVQGLGKRGSLHGMHVHSLGDLTNGCASTGTHFNPFGKNHGGPNAPERHLGDLGNIQANNFGVAQINIVDEQVKLFGEYSVIGRAMVVHEKEDDLGFGGNEESLKTGNAGARLGCCVIGLADPGPQNPPPRPPLPPPKG